MTNLQVSDDKIVVECGIGRLLEINGVLYVTNKNGMTRVSLEV